MLLPQINWIKNISCNVTWQRLSLVCRWVMGESASTHDPSKKLTHYHLLCCAACSSRGYIAARTAVQQWGEQCPGSPRVPGPKNNAHLSPVQNLQLITFTTISVVWASCARGWLIRPARSSGGYIAARTFENQLRPITLATHADRTLIDHCLQNGGFFTFLVYINCRKNYNEGFDSKLTHKLLYCKSITKSKKN